MLRQSMRLLHRSVWRKASASWRIERYETVFLKSGQMLALNARQAQSKMSAKGYSWCRQLVRVGKICVRCTLLCDLVWGRLSLVHWNYRCQTVKSKLRPGKPRPASRTDVKPIRRNGSSPLVCYENRFRKVSVANKELSGHLI